MIIGVTGIIGSGKSTVAELLSKRFNAEIVDADKIGHQVLEKNKFVHFCLRRIFGSTERKIIARQVFASRTKLFFLNFLTHPFIRSHVRKILRKKGNFVLDAALLFSLRLDKYCGRIIFVTADLKTLNQRLKKRGYTPAQIQQRISANQTVYQKKHLGTVITNNGTLAQLKKKIEDI